MSLVGRTRTPSILQLEAAECGAAALGIVLGFHGRHVPLEQLRGLCGVSRDGAKASSILKAGRSFGLEAKGMKAEPEHLADMPWPMIAFVNFNHFLVVEKATATHVWLNDPASGRRRVEMAEFSEGFTGVVLTFTKGPEFKRGDARSSILGALWRRLDGFRVALLFVFLVNLALVIPGIVVPVFSRIFVDYVLVRGLEDWIAPVLIGMALTALVRFVLLEVQGMTLLRLTNALTLKTGGELFWRLLRLPVSFFDQRFAGEIADRIRLNESLAALLTGQLAGALIAVITSVFFAAAMFLYHEGLATAVVALAFLNIIVLRVSTRALSEKYRKVSIDAGKLQGARIAALKDMETFKASGAEDIVFSRWMGLQTNVVNGRQEAGRIAAWTGPAPGLISALITATVLIYGGWLVMQGELTLGMLVAFQSLAASFTGPIAQLAGFGAELQELRSYTQRLEDVLDQPLDARFQREAAAVDRLPRGEIRLRDVRFGYAPMSPPLIDGLDLDIAPGQRVALVGASGSGKSTIGKLIAGLEVPQSGEVTIDGIAPADWPRPALSQRFAYIQQEAALFEGTVRENLTLWNEGTGEAAVIAASHDASAHEMISARNGGYEAVLAEGGGNFSGGEQQRLEIARALASDPSIIVLDEATSALDPIAEKSVMDAIRRRGATSVIIAHRLSVIRDCDEIIVLDRGRPVERGRHEDLISSGGAYARLIEA
ncbi:NHLP family bacteriocin export ABC transporter peptidase/permease/ATPase subunit [Rhodobacteraceae bacterium NNCM2]|nr:NHLP family bacteriocin export ABC transporter peptidase/permease/ATPase subunit [Coraliihabitans acroporae]